MTIVHLIKLLDPSIWSQHVLGVPSCLKAVFKGSKCCFWQDHRRQMQSFTVSSRETIFQQKPMGFFKDGVQGEKWHTPGSLTYPVKNYHPKRQGLLQPSFFRGYVKLQGCIHGRKQKTSNWVFLFGRALMPLFTRECKHNKRKACRFGIRSDRQNRSGGWLYRGSGDWNLRDMCENRRFRQFPHSWILGPASRACLFSLILNYLLIRGTTLQTTRVWGYRYIFIYTYDVYMGARCTFLAPPPTPMVWSPLIPRSTSSNSSTSSTSTSTT